MITALIGLGSNVGDREAAIRLALDKLRKIEGIRVARVSSLVETEPQGCPEGSGRFLNAVARLETTLTPRSLLDALLLIERKLGRERGLERNAPRTLDLDLLLYGGRVLDEPGLVVPHPRMTERWFVLWPLLQIEPRAIDPRDGHPFADDLQRLKAEAP